MSRHQKHRQLERWEKLIISIWDQYPGVGDETHHVAVGRRSVTRSSERCEKRPQTFHCNAPECIPKRSYQSGRLLLEMKPAFLSWCATFKLVTLRLLVVGEPY